MTVPVNGPKAGPRKDGSQDESPSSGKELDPRPTTPSRWIHSTANYLVRVFQWALNVSFEDDEFSRSRIQENSAIEDFHRYQRSAAVQDIDGAVAHAREAVKLAPANQPARAGSLRILAAALVCRYERLATSQDIEDAITHSKEALPLTPEGPDRCTSLQTIAWVYKNKYEVTRELKCLNLAIQYYDEALALEPGEDEYLRCIQGLSASLGSRYQETQYIGDLNRALQYDQELVEKIGKGDPDRPAYLRNLASSWHDLHRHRKNQQNASPQNGSSSNEPDYLKNAIDRVREALKEIDKTVTDPLQDIPPAHPLRPECFQNLALYLTDRCHDLENQPSEDLSEIFRCYSESCNAVVFNPAASFDAARRWASLAQDKGKHEECTTAYKAAFRLLPEILWIGNSLAAHKEACQRIDITDATSDALSAFIAVEDLEGAIQLVDQGLATALQQNMQLKTRPHESLSPWDQQKLETLSFLIYDGCTSLDDRRKAVELRENMLTKIRRQPGLTHFLQCKPYSQISNAAKNRPVVILNSHENGCDALILHKLGEAPLHLPLKNIHHELAVIIQTFKHLRGSRAPKSAREGTSDMDLNGLLEWLKQWIPFNHLVQNGFTDGNRLWWCPIGRFKGLPLHAASDPTWFIPSYTLTLDALVKTQPNQDSASNWKMGIVGILETGPNGENRLLKVEDEINGILKHARDAQKPDILRNGTAEAVKTLLQECSWIHFACHGEQNKPDPQNSCLLLYESTLTLDAILRLQLPHAEFAFLSACETIRGDDKVINEALHLGGGFIAAGFQGVIGTLWNMADEDGPKLAEDVYGHLFRNPGPPKVTDVAKALHIAVGELRRSKVSPERWVPFIHIGV
ncbi:CHAT domain-containing protein [Mycena leptocephala]|nr:CHAT domain-containing protein [Mycena leptocephala]